MVTNSRYGVASFCCLAILSFLLSSCTNDPYESGDTALSYFQADFVEAHTVAAKQFDRAVTDGGVTLSLSPYATAEWATTADSTYRALLYYNKVEDGTTSPYSIVSVPVLHYKRLADDEQMHADPVTFESSWLSKNGKYLNLGLLLKTGVADELDARHTVGMVLNAVTAQPDGSNLYDLQFFHQQNGVPQYYSARVYVSIPLAEMRPGDTVRVTVNTYSGSVVKEYGL